MINNTKVLEDRVNLDKNKIDEISNNFSKLNSEYEKMVFERNANKIIKNLDNALLLVFFYFF